MEVIVAVEFLETVWQTGEDDDDESVVFQGRMHPSLALLARSRAADGLLLVSVLPGLW